MKLELEINMDNAAFEDNEGAEAARIMRDAADSVEMGCIRASLFDLNGNTVGKFHIIGRSVHAVKDKRGSYPRRKQ